MCEATIFQTFFTPLLKPNSDMSCVLTHLTVCTDPGNGAGAVFCTCETQLLVHIFSGRLLNATDDTDSSINHTV